MKKKKAFTIIELMVVIAIIFILVALLYPAIQAVRNNKNASQEQNQVADSGAKQVAATEIPMYKEGKTYEQWSINNRQLVTNDPTKVMWLHFLNMEGKPTNRMPVRCKMTSSKKRLRPNEAISKPYQSGGVLPEYVTKDGTKYFTNEFIKDDGTFGESEAYSFWFDPLSRYHQIGSFGGGAMCYLLTDYPIDLADPIDAVSNLYKVHKISADWQKITEAELRAELSEASEREG